ncbi:MAG: pyruvate kinase [Spirochaetales bacterium]|nr:MAG: pyruvate kinase [Spirochaetales bacterium]
MKTKLTKILATIPSGCDAAFIRKLYEAGMNAVRLNTAHQNPVESLEVVHLVRSVSPNIAVLIDTKGPEVRVRGVDTPVPVKTGDEIFVLGPDAKPPAGKPSFSTSYPGFVEEVSVSTAILIDDGLIELRVEEKDGNTLLCRAYNNGEIKKNKSINTPGSHLKLPALQEKDKEYIQFAIEHDIDFIAHSFVRNKEDIMAIQELLDAGHSAVKIIAKIENQEGVDHLDEILQHSSGVMVARGDLGVEVPLEKLPAIQKHLISTCIKEGKTVITATQMLQSMIENPRPTRAEVSDVANAVFDGTDVLMLSGETAYGKYPAEAVRVMARIAVEAEAVRPEFNFVSEATSNQIRSFLVESAARAVKELPIKAIIADTMTGKVARILSSYRPQVPIYAKSPSARTVRELALSYGVISDLQEMQDSTDTLIKASINSLLEEGLLQIEDLVVLIGSPPGSSGSTNFIQITSAFLAMAVV